MFGKKHKRVAVHIVDEGIALVAADTKENKIKIELLAQLALDKEELSKFVQKNQLKNLPAYLVIGGKQIVSRVITMPEMPPGELRQAILWEFTKYISIPPEDMVFDYEIIKKFTEDESTKLQLQIVATRKKHVEYYCDLLAKAGLKPVLVNVEGIILKYLYLKLENKQEEKETCFIFLDEDRAVFSFIKDNRVLFIHNVEGINKTNSKIVNEYLRVSDYLKRQFDIKAINSIYLWGTWLEDNTFKFLQENTGVLIQVAELSSEKFVWSENIKAIDPIYFFALGLFLQEVE